MTGLFSREQNSRDQLHALDYRIMELAFEIHNRMGNFHDEQVYQNELAHRLREKGIRVEQEVPLPIEYKTFKKTYFLDLLIEGCHIYELKAQSSLAKQNRSQLINYQLMAELAYGKLINFGGSSVQHEFVTTHLVKSDRQQLTIDDSGWASGTESDHALRSLSHDLFLEWGSRLDPLLYTEAILFLLPDTRSDRVNIRSGEHILGTKRVNLIAPDTAIKVTTAKTPNPLEIQFKKFLNHTELDSLLWINLNRNHITYKILRKNHPVI